MRMYDGFVFVKNTDLNAFLANEKLYKFMCFPFNTFPKLST